MTHPQAGLLDPAAKKLMGLLSRLRTPGYETMTPETARIAAAQAVRNAPLPKVSVGGVEDLSFNTGEYALRARIYRPLTKPSATAGPALIYFHGGGWVLGDLDSHDHLCRSLVRSAGITVVSIDYPLSPKFQFPYPLLASAAAVRWVFEQAETLNLDPTRIGLAGDSSGGNLVAALALMARDKELPSPRVQCLLYPCLDLTMSLASYGLTLEGLPFSAKTMGWFINLYAPQTTDRNDWRASPLFARDVSGTAPAYVMTVGFDVLRDEGRAYANKLTQAGVPVVEKHFPGQIHAFLTMPNVLPTAYEAIADLGEFLVVNLCDFPST